MKKPLLRVLIIGLNYAPEPTGIAPYTTRLAEQLATEGHNVTVLAGFPHYPEWKLREGYTGWTQHEVIEDVLVKRLRHFIPVRVNEAHRLHLELSFGLRVLFARWNKPDVIIVVTPALFASAFALIRARFGIRRPASGVWVQDIYSRGLAEMNQESSLAARLMRVIEGLILRSATKVTVIHDRFKHYLTSSLGVPQDDITVIRNWTHIERSRPVDRSGMRSRWGWKDDDVVVLHAGNMGAKQSLENVVAAARLADLHNSRVRFVLLGDGNQRPRIQGLAGGIDRIQFIDPLSSEVFEATLGSADVLLVNEMVGLREMAVPSKLTSYFATGLPVIAATEMDSTTAGEIDVARGGIRVEPDAPVALLEAAERLGSDPALSQKLGKAGIHYAENTLSQDAAIMQYSAWLQELAAAGQSAGPGAGKFLKQKQRSRGIRVD